MFNYGLRHSMFLFQKLQSTLSFSFNTINKTCFNLNGIQISDFIRRNLCQTVQIKSKEEIDEFHQKELDKLLENPAYSKAYKLLQYEIEYMREMSENVPKVIRPKDYIYLLNSPSKTHQRKHIRFLFCNEIKRENLKEKRKQKSEELRLELEEYRKVCPSGLLYGLGHNSLFLRIYDQTLDSYLNYNSAIYSRFEPKIVFDCGYNNVMSPFEIKNCARQLVLSLVFNRQHRTPAELYFCNAAPENEIVTTLLKLVPNLYEDTFPANVTPLSYLDMFDKNELVYLTPHCKTEMTHYDPDKVYIIGAMVDKASPQPYSLAKAKKEKLRMEKLPLDRYLNWGSGSNKCLTLNQVLAILLDIKYTKDWMTSLFNHIPIRKLQPEQRMDREKFYEKITARTKNG
ncbi:PREDICTED: mitochondrial ribonuclease P protein 1 homolog [Polistes dominula]|uniref:RNA (guanine-9-)-methyltransferase domain-containing protein 1 n=1 Tax=Polistes dominula TaxID=743375 RepID=A0ABM1ISB8_POLDO|nr:PREDICTED: mitochondrial ribonuclease P protein 1 homolog [Polistes dominula]